MSVKTDPKTFKMSNACFISLCQSRKNRSGLLPQTKATTNHITGSALLKNAIKSLGKITL